MQWALAILTVIAYATLPLGSASFEQQPVPTLLAGLAFVLGAIGVALAAWVLRLRLKTRRYRLAVIELMARTKRDAHTDVSPEDHREDDNDDVGARTARLLALLN